MNEGTTKTATRTIVALVGLSLALLSGWSFGPARAATSYLGGAQSQEKKEAGEKTEKSGVFTNKSGKEFQDFVISLDGHEGEIKKVEVLDGDGNPVGEFKVDDNHDGDLDDNETDNNRDDQDGGFKKTVRVINNKAKGEGIGDDEDFQLKVTMTSPAGKNWTWNATIRRKKDEDKPGIGGPQASIYQPFGPTGTYAASVWNDFGMGSVCITGMNMGSTMCTSVTLTPPPGVTVAEVESDEDGRIGTWNPATGTFSFQPPVPPGGDVSFVFTLDQLGAGDWTDVEWTPNY